MLRYTLSRIGCLIFLAGGIVLLLGVAAESSGHPAFDLVLSGIGLAFFGFLLWNKLRERKNRSRRFSMFRKNSWDEEEPGEGEDNWKE